jgi:arylsulfatase
LQYHPRVPRTPLLAWSLLALLLTACGREEAGPRNVLLVVVDTLRADRLSLYGYRRPTSPHLDAFAREGVTFLNARSPAGCTFPSVNALLTSRDPAVFLGGPDLGIPETVRSLPEILRDHGYSTAAVSASPIVRNTPSRMNPAGGFGRGFQTFDEDCWKKHAACVNQKALGLVQALPEPWFLYLHYLEPHGPYRPAANHPRKFAPKDPEGVRPWARRGEAFPVGRRLYDGDTRYQFGPRDLAHLSNLYDEEIAYFDQQFKKILDDLRERDLLDRTAIVLAADHGEEMYEHGHFGHCRDLAYETVLKTPLFLRLPGTTNGVKQGLRRKSLANNLDIVPTLLDYLGLPAAGQTFDGKSLRPVIEKDQPIRRLSFGLQGVARIATDGTLKLTFDLATGRTHLFDLKADPGEKTDLSTRRPEETRRLQAALLRWMETREGPRGESRRKAEELEKKLRALGYL